MAAVTDINSEDYLVVLSQKAVAFRREVHAPERIFKWVDPETAAEGYLVLYSIINGVSGGGIFMHAGATLQEVIDIAANMSRKFTVTRPQIGGAKAGIRFDHKDPRASGVLRRFIRTMAEQLRSVWVTAGDLNTDDQFIEKCIQEDIGLPTCQHFLAFLYAASTQSTNRSEMLKKFIPHPASPFFPLIEGAVGYGVARAVEAIVRFARFADLQECPANSAKPRIVIQGFGAVGSSLAYFCDVHGIADVVGIADKDGYLYHSDGQPLPVREMLLQRARVIAMLDTDADRRSVHQKNLICNLNDEFCSMHGLVLCRRATVNSKPSAAEEEGFLLSFLKTVPQFDVLSLCASRYALTPAIVQLLLASTSRRFVVCGANNVFGVVNQDGTAAEDAANSGLNALQQAGHVVVPDWVANSGTAQLFHRVLSVGFEESQTDVAQQILDACAKPIVEYIDKAANLVSHHLQYVAFACESIAEYVQKYPIPFPETETSGVAVGMPPLIQLSLPMELVPGRSPYNCLPLLSALQIPVEERVMRISRCLEEVFPEDSLVSLISNCSSPVAYDGFEPSGRMHIAQGIRKRIIVDTLTECGFTFIFWVADWFAFLNHKMGGRMESIRLVGEYFIEVWKACGMKMDRVKFLWASEEFHKRGDEYWARVLDISTKFSVDRITRCGAIMGRSDKNLSASQIFYPCMQCADIFFLGVDGCQLGTDQRKVNVLALEYADKASLPKPVIMSHHMLPGLKMGQEKMSKSDPASAIFMEDSPEEVEQKIGGAFCPPATVERNPCMAYMQLIVFPAAKSAIQVLLNNNLSRYYGAADFCRFSEDYVAGIVSPQELKRVLALEINKLLEPVRQHFRQDDHARRLLEEVAKLRADTSGTSPAA